MRGWIVTLAAIAVGCGSEVTVQPSGAGGATSSSSSSSSTGQGGSIPDECQVPTDLPAPYATLIRFTNSAPQPLYLRTDCALQYELTSCADDYAQPIARNQGCTISCGGSNPDDCIQCEPCPYGVIELLPGEVYDDPWSGVGYTFSTTPSGCACHDAYDVPAGKYRVSALIYPSEDAAFVGEWSHSVAVDFDLPSSSVVVDVAP